MKKIVTAILAACMITTAAVAQEAKPSGQQPPKPKDKTEMVKHRTDNMVKRYKLNAAQAKQLQELNARYADKMQPPRGPRPEGGPQAGQGKQGQKGAKAQQGQQRPPVRPDSIRGQRPQRPPMSEEMKAYEAELQRIMTPEQYKSYQADMQRRGRHHGHGQRPPREN